MGKAKKEKAVKGERFKPTPVVSMQDIERMQESGELTEEDSLPLLEKMDSVHDGDRENACAFLANIVLQGEHERQILLRENVIRKLSSRVIDTSVAVRAAAAGALRNLSLCLDHEIRDRMVHDDALTPLIVALIQAIETLKGEAAQGDPKLMKSAQTLAENLVACFWHLAESSERAVELLCAQERALDAVVEFLRPGVPPELLLTAAQCVQVLTDENPRMVAYFAARPALLLSLSALTQSTDETVDVLTRTVAAGIAYNVRDAAPGADVRGPVVGVLVRTLEWDAVAALPDILPRLQSAEPYENGVGAAGDLFPEASAWKRAVSAQVLAAELLANMCQEGAEDEGEEGEEEEGWEESAGDEPAAPPEAGPADAPALPPAAAAAIASSGVPRLVLAKCRAVPPAAPGASPLVLEAREQLRTLQLRSLACLGNMLQAMPPAAFGELGGAWEALVQTCEAVATGNDSEVLEAVTLAMWLLLRCGGPKSPIPFVGESHLAGMAKIAKHPCAEVRENALRMLAAVGTRPHDPATNAVRRPSRPPPRPAPLDLALRWQALGRGLLEAAEGDASLACAAAALDALYDVYAEEQYDANVRALEMVPRLERLLPALKQRIAASKGPAEREARERAREARLNLPRFIAYKKKHMR
eukprot:tig00000743_g3866.t1